MEELNLCEVYVPGDVCGRIPDRRGANFEGAQVQRSRVIVGDLKWTLRTSQVAEIDRCMDVGHNWIFSKGGVNAGDKNSHRGLMRNSLLIMMNG